MPSELWGHADFIRLWTAQAVRAFGWRITRTAMPIIAVKTLGASETIVGALAALQSAPGPVLALFVGGVVDRSRKKRILIAANLASAIVIGSLTIAWALGMLSIVHVIVVGALVNAAGALFQITDVAYLPVVVAPHQLVDANSKLEATEAVAEVTGPATAGALIAGLGAPLAVVVDALSYVWSAARIASIRTVESISSAQASGVLSAAASQSASASRSVEWQTTRDLRKGMRAVFGHPLVRPIVLMTMVSMLNGGFFVTTYPMWLLRSLQLPESTYGIIVAMGGIGSLGGALLSRRLARAIGVGPTIILTCTVSFLAGLFIPLAAGGSHTRMLVFLGAHQLIADGFSVALVIQLVTLRQTVLPRNVLGRANAAIHVCTMGVFPISALVAGILADTVSIRFAVWLGVAIGLVTPLFLLPLRRVHDMPRAAD
jgi:MFS family permease